jgi:hypothetical protein
MPENFSGAGFALTREEGRAYRPKTITLALQGLERTEGVPAWGCRSNIQTGWRSDRIQQIEQIPWT